MTQPGFAEGPVQKVVDPAVSLQPFYPYDILPVSLQETSR